MEKRSTASEMTELHLMVLEKGELSCSDVVEVMGDYYDGELIPTVKARVDAHIASCEECQEFVRTYAFTVKLAQSLRSVPPTPPGMQNRLRAALNQRLGLSMALNAD